MAIDPSFYPEYALECGDPSRTKTLGFGTHPAILLVDLCKAYTSPASPLALNESAIAQCIATTTALLESARSTYRNLAKDTMPVFYAQTVYTHPALLDAGLVGQKNPHASLFSASNPSAYTSVGDDSNPDFSKLQPQPVDTILRKKYPSAFLGTNLATQLTALGVDTVVIGGFLTSVAVRSTAIDAMQAGFRSIVVMEACADLGSETHWASLMDHNAKYGDVIGVEEALMNIKRGWTGGLE